MKKTLYKIPGVGKWVWNHDWRQVMFKAKGEDNPKYTYNLPMSNNTLTDARRIAVHQEMLRLRKEEGNSQARNSIYRSQSTQTGATNGQANEEATQAGEQEPQGQAKGSDGSLPIS